MNAQPIAVIPVNPVTGNPYTGRNVLSLVDAMDSNPRFVSGAFATFRQWLTAGRCVRKGEKGAARLVTYGKAGETQEADKPQRGSFVKGFTVFALEQTDALPADRVGEVAAHDEQQEAAPAACQPTPKPTKTPLAFDKLAAKAEKLLADAEACCADRLQNTPKRLAQAMHKRMDGQRKERAAHIIKAYIAATDAGQDPLPGVTASQLIAWAQEAAICKATPVSNGYHGYHVETSDAAHSEPHHITLRGLLDPRTSAASSARIAKEQAEADLRNIDAAGFFPTPAGVIATMLEYAGNLSGAHVLEPSAGKGDLVAAAFAAGARSVTSYEINGRLASYLAQHVTVPAGCSHATQHADFMGREPLPVPVDVVLMNPPFERNQAPAHVRHALRFLKDGGKLVAVMPGGWIEKPSADALLADIEAQGRSYTEIDIEGPAFAGADAFRQTSVRVSLLVVS